MSKLDLLPTKHLNMLLLQSANKINKNDYFYINAIYMNQILSAFINIVSMLIYKHIYNMVARGFFVYINIEVTMNLLH